MPHMTEQDLAARALEKFEENHSEEERVEAALAEKYTPQELSRMLVELAKKADTKLQTSDITYKPLPDEETVLASKYLPKWEVDAERRIAGETGKPNHTLMVGDNIHALTGMVVAGDKFDVIYIDPPYNTGNKDFIYNDRFVGEEDSFSHTKWLSMMAPRLRLAKELLTKDGVIVVSIGDREQARLTRLMDSIFGENNRLGTVVRKSKVGSNYGTWFADSHDYLLFYGQCSEVTGFVVERTEAQQAAFNLTDGQGSFKLISLFTTGLLSGPNQKYVMRAPDGSLVVPPVGRFSEQMGEGDLSTNLDKAMGCFRWAVGKYNQEVVNQPFENKGDYWSRGSLVWKKSNQSSLKNLDGSPSEWNVYSKHYLDEVKSLLPRTVWDDAAFSNNAAARELTALGIEFSYSKPVDLIKQIIRIMGKPNDIKVLDFFAGSGTTGQAVIELNAEDGGTREVTLVTNNENNIAHEVTLPRLTKVITGQGWADEKEHPSYGDSVNVVNVGACETLPEYPAMLKTNHPFMVKWVEESHALFAHALGYETLELTGDGYVVYGEGTEGVVLITSIYQGSDELEGLPDHCEHYKVGVLAYSENPDDWFTEGDFPLPGNYAKMMNKVHGLLNADSAHYGYYYNNIVATVPKENN